MKIDLVAGCGFCPGVKRALAMAENAAAAGCIHTLGPLIHNPQEIARLEPRIHCVDTLEQAGERVLIRSHGIAPALFAKAEQMGIAVIDATCPFVKRAQQQAKVWAEAGWQVIVVGDAKHPEVQGICAWSGDSAIVVGNVAEAEALPFLPKAAVLAQTTQTAATFRACADVIRAKAGEYTEQNTICTHTEKVQQATAAVAQCVEAMIVIGGKNSANTIKLAQISAEAGCDVRHIETAAEIDIDFVRSHGTFGITAGASTPQHIIEEVINRMSELENKAEEFKAVVEDVIEEIKDKAEQVIDAVEEKIAEVKEAIEEKVSEIQEEQTEEEIADTFAQEYGDMKEIRRGACVKGIVVQVKDDELLVDIGGKSEGVLTASELSAEDAKNIHERFHAGDEIDVLILRRENQEGYPVLSKRRVDQDQAWDKLAQLKQDKEIVAGTVTDVVKGGVLVDVGLRGFVPASLLSLGYVEDLSTYLGKELQMKIIECDRHANKLVLSAKAVLRSNSRVQKEKTWSEIEEGQTLHGVVRRLTGFGAFVDIGGVDGLLHVSEMAWYRVNHPSDLLKEGDELDVYVLGVDKENERISLGLKQLIPNPWTLVQEKYPEGSMIAARVMRTTTFGAFLEVEPGVEGLVHISQMANHRVEKTEDVVKPGDEVQVKVLAVDPVAKRMSLSIKACLPEEEQPIMSDDMPLPEEAFAVEEAPVLAEEPAPEQVPALEEVPAEEE